MNHRYDTVLFDLDGTLCETGEGIKESIRHSLGKMGRPIPEEKALRRFIGPPLWESYKQFCGMTQQEADEGVRLFRSYYDEIGWRKTRLYPGIQGLLRDLHAQGIRVSTATSKPEPAARRILEYMGVLPYFTAVVGSLPSGARSQKRELIPYALQQCGASPKTRAVMIGDTHFDAEGAQQTGLDFIGVTYGYGTRQELERYKAVALAQNVECLREVLLK